ncbi:MAG: hypothetical protein ABI945_04820 [Nitrospirales bacterium]
MQPLVTQPTLDVTKEPFKASVKRVQSVERTDRRDFQAVTDLTAPTKNFT